MKKHLLLWLCLASFSCFGQLPYLESFEDLIGFTPQVNIIDNLSDYFARMDTDCTSVPDPCEVNGSGGYSGWLGTYYWAGEDHDDPGILSGNFQTLCITLDPIDISANTSGAIEIGAYYAANTVGNAHDPSPLDAVSLTYRIDGGATQTAQFFAYYTPNGGTNEYLAYDEDNNGAVDGAESTLLTSTFTRYTRLVATTGNSLVITLCAHSNSSSEEWAIDGIEVSGAMPVELSQFTVQPKDDGALLNWSTASETNNAYFAIERGINGIDFEEVSKVAGKGTSYASNEYDYFDTDLPDHKFVYYRLRQVDHNGNYSFSQVRAILNKVQEGDLRVYPNPTKSKIELLLSGDIKESIRVQIFDLNGRLLSSQELPPSNAPVIDVNTLAEGQYLIRAQSGAYSWTERFVKMD